MTMRKRFGWAMLLAVALLAPAAGTKGGENESLGFDQAPKPRLTIGSVAPPLDIEHWLQTGKGAFGPVTTFEADHVYVVEFWATWCGPCVASMPHLAKLQQKYADKQVQIISITAEEPATVEPFLDRKVRGYDTQTYRALTSAYCLTSDPDRSCNDAYMKAAGERGIPTAFIVGKDGHIEWIGHPMTMDEPLASIVDSTWDRKTFAASFQQMKVVEQVFSSGWQGKLTAVIERLEQLSNATELEDVKTKIEQIIDRLKKRQLVESLNSPNADLAGLETSLAHADLRDLVWVAQQIGRGLSENTIPKRNEVASTLLDCLEKRFCGDANDQMVCQIYANILRVAGTPEQAATRIETLLETYDGPARPMLEQTATWIAKEQAEETGAAANN